MTINTQKLREFSELEGFTQENICDLLDHIDAQVAEIAEAKGRIEHLDRQNTGLLAQHDRDSKTLREYAQARDGLRRACAALEAEKARLRYALRWTSAALQEACRRPTIITEKDRWRIDREVRTTGEILASADAALSGESND